MPTFTGTSVNGRQNLAVRTLNTRDFIAIDFPQLDLQDAGQRIGLLLVCQALEDFNPRVVEVYKLFGGGILAVPSYPLIPLDYQIIVDWYRPQLAWNLFWNPVS